MSESPHTPKAAQVNLRCTYEEEEAIASACEALGMSLSTLIEISVHQAVIDLGMTLLDEAAPRLKTGYVWPFAPRRPEGESSKARVTAYITAAVFPTLESAAWAVRLSTPLFCIGSTLRQIALAKLANERRQKSSPNTFNAKLAKVKVPYDFDGLVRSTRH
jgi:hypothetical protein